MTATQSGNTDLADKLLTQAFVIIDINISVGPGSRQLSWEALDFNEAQLRTLRGSMAATPPSVEAFPELKKAGVRLRSAVRGFQHRWTVQSDAFWLYPQSDEESVAEALFLIASQADKERAAIIATAVQARERWNQHVDELLYQAGISDPDIKDRIQRFFPSDQRLEGCLSVTWNVRVIPSLEQQAAESVQLQEALQGRRELSARERLHYESERMVMQAAQRAADAAADKTASLLANVLSDLNEGVKGKPMNGQRRVRLNNLTSQLESLAKCFSGSGGLLDVAARIKAFTKGVAPTHHQGSEVFEQQLAELKAAINSETASLKDPTKRGHRSIAEFIR